MLELNWGRGHGILGGRHGGAHDGERRRLRAGTAHAVLREQFVFRTVCSRRFRSRGSTSPKTVLQRCYRRSRRHGPLGYPPNPDVHRAISREKDAARDATTTCHTSALRSAMSAQRLGMVIR